MALVNYVIDEIDEIDEKYKELGKEIQKLKKQKESLRNRVKEFNKDEEIMRLKLDIIDVKTRSLYNMTNVELDRSSKFRSTHYETCFQEHRHNAPGFWYQLTGTGIGTSITIRCPICGEESDITDTSVW